jgi:hypothetical protein
MAKLSDLEDGIMKCWTITDDIDALYVRVMDEVDYGKLDSDEMANYLLGLKTIYDVKFNQLFNLYASIIAAEATQ